MHLRGCVAVIVRLSVGFLLPLNHELLFRGDAVA
jgi:hypothetical protein